MNCETLERSEVADESTRTGVKRSDVSYFSCSKYKRPGAPGVSVPDQTP